MKRDQEYYQEFLSTKAFLIREYPGAEISEFLDESYKGKEDFFEIYVNGKLVHSKIGGDGFVSNENCEDLLEKIDRI